MSALDGNFNSTVEAVTVTLDTTGFASGRHLLYLRGRDSANYQGAVSAAFLTVIDPATAPFLEGTVTELGSGTPLAATVRVGPFSTPTVPATGAYSIQVPEGTYDVTATAADHAPATAYGVTLATLQTVIQDFALVAYSTVLDDDVEGGNIGWTTGQAGTWAITNAQWHSPSNSWTDSPGGVYGNNRNTALTSPRKRSCSLGLRELLQATTMLSPLWRRKRTNRIVMSSGARAGRTCSTSSAGNPRWL